MTYLIFTKEGELVDLIDFLDKEQMDSFKENNPDLDLILEDEILFQDGLEDSTEDYMDYDILI